MKSELGTEDQRTVASVLTNIGYSYQAILKKLVVNPGEDGGQELVATFVIVPNNVVDELRRLMGQSVMLRVQPRQLPLPLDDNSRTVSSAGVRTGRDTLPEH